MGEASLVRLKGLAKLHLNATIEDPQLQSPCLLDELTVARGDGSCPKLIQRLART